MNDRGMVKWMPYQSLVEQSSFLARMRYEKNKKPRKRTCGALNGEADGT